ncbi:saxiphilin-like [Amphibalanus amphitrite]|uniref:saxiphilin-like n=1 Tax=Amphibalanus amphitrite TaxID=1232801 RepID=UPI001C8FE0A1|nr:saxiphilin-like [Amphibalanus amphitrite]
MKPVFVLLACVPLLVSAKSLLGADQPCWDELKSIEGVSRPGLFRPECDRLGRYMPQQCHGSACFCVDPSGAKLFADHENQVDQYTTHIGSSALQSCRCARQEFEHREGGRVGVSVSCDEKGDFHHTQCLGSGCYCVHPLTGEKLQGENLEGHIGGYAELEARCQPAAAEAVAQ